MFKYYIIKELIKQCEAKYPEEACGLIAGIKGEPESDRVVPCINIAGKKFSSPEKKQEDIQKRTFAMDPDELIHILNDMRGNGEFLKAIYHSHPDSDASFSELDYEYSVPSCIKTEDKPEPLYRNIAYIVVSVIKGHVSELKSYEWNQDKGGFSETNPLS